MLVFAGGGDLLSRFRPIIVGEFNPYWMTQIGQSFATVTEFFGNLYYLTYREIDGRLCPFTADLVARSPEIPTYWLVPREAAGRVITLAGS